MLATATAWLHRGSVQLANEGRTEESAAHHLYEKTVQNIFWKTLEFILNDFGTFVFCQILAHKATKSQNWQRLPEQISILDHQS